MSHLCPRGELKVFKKTDVHLKLTGLAKTAHFVWLSSSRTSEVSKNTLSGAIHLKQSYALCYCNEKTQHKNANAQDGSFMLAVTVTENQWWAKCCCMAPLYLALNPVSKTGKTLYIWLTSNRSGYKIILQILKAIIQKVVIC